MQKRASGILLHITSLPSEYGIGDFGPQAYKFVDFLAQAKQHYWQILPINPAVGNSPYNCLSAFAINPLFISPDLLYRKGLLKKEELKNRPVFPKGNINYQSAIFYKTNLFNKAYENFKKLPKDSDFKNFCLQNKDWLEDFAIFIAIRKHFGTGLWCNWPKEIRDKNKNALRFLKSELKEEIEKRKFFQFQLFNQWHLLKKYCEQKNIRIIGDIPIYVALDSADVWSCPEFFKLTPGKKPRFVSGVAPDYFSSTGQLWGNPVYDWKILKKTGCRWWLDRIKHNLNFFDIARLDHFRAFIAYWQVPSGQKTAEKGKWVKGPGKDFFKKLLKPISAQRFIVEDLGYITEDVNEVIRYFNLSGMKVLIFSFDGNPAKNPHCLHNHLQNSVVYTTTHDTNTIKGWFDKEAKPSQIKRFFDYIGWKVSPDKINWEMIRLAMSSASWLSITPMQDILGLGEKAHMNRPGTIDGNWSWQLETSKVPVKIINKLAKLTEIYGRY